MPDLDHGNYVIAPTLFRDNTLVITSFSCWTGAASVREGDEDIFGSRSFDNRFFKGAGIILAEKEKLKPFKNRWSRLSTWLDSMGSKFHIIPGCRIFRNSYLEEVNAEIDGCAKDINEMAAEFAEKYRDDVERRCLEFDTAHPEAAGRLRGYFPPHHKIASKFGVTSVGIEVSDSAAFEQIIKDEQNSFRSHIKVLAEDLASGFRETAVAAAIAFKNGMEKANSSENGVVNSRSVKAFKDFLERFERNNFLNDRKLSDMLAQMKTQVFSVADWNVKDDPAALAHVREHLAEIIKIGEEEGAASMVIDEFIISANSPSVEIDEAPVDMDFAGAQIGDIEVDYGAPEVAQQELVIEPQQA